MQKDHLSLLMATWWFSLGRAPPNANLQWDVDQSIIWCIPLRFQANHVGQTYQIWRVSVNYMCCLQYLWHSSWGWEGTWQLGLQIEGLPWYLLFTLLFPFPMLDALYIDRSLGVFFLAKWMHVQWRTEMLVVLVEPEFCGELNLGLPSIQSSEIHLKYSHWLEQFSLKWLSPCSCREKKK